MEKVSFLIEIGPLHVATTRFFSDDDVELAWNINFHKKREEIYDYEMPNIKQNQGINIIASAFGYKYMVNDEANPWIKPLICEEDINDMYINLKLRSGEQSIL